MEANTKLRLNPLHVRPSPTGKDERTGRDEFDNNLQSV